MSSLLLPFFFVVGGHRFFFSVRFTPGKGVHLFLNSDFTVALFGSVLKVLGSRLDSDKELYFLSKSNHGHSIFLSRVEMKPIWPDDLVLLKFCSL